MLSDLQDWNDPGAASTLRPHSGGELHLLKTSSMPSSWWAGYVQGKSCLLAHAAAAGIKVSYIGFMLLVCNVVAKPTLNRHSPGLSSQNCCLPLVCQLATCMADQICNT